MRGILMKASQLSLFEKVTETPADALADVRVSRSGTFVDNMALPIHRWFRYSAGFSAEWVEQLLQSWGSSPDSSVLDPFAGSGTVSLVCDTLGIPSIGIEAHPVVSRISKAKMSWATPVERFVEFAALVAEAASDVSVDQVVSPDLLQRSIDVEVLNRLNAFKLAWETHNDQSPASELTWLALTAILRPCATAGTAQWQYILPNKSKKKVLHPDVAFREQVAVMASDMRWMQSRADCSHAAMLTGDARMCSDLVKPHVDRVITSPPYANNYDYADALRFEMTFWGDVNGWGDIHDKVRKYLIVSSSQHSSKEKLQAEEVLASPVLDPIRAELTDIVNRLASTRLEHGGKKHYHTMIAAYCRDIGVVLQELWRVCRTGARMCWVIGDSAPYGVYCPLDEWIGEMALNAGFTAYTFEKLRDRNTKWKNRKHRVPLKEGLLWIEG